MTETATEETRTEQRPLIATLEGDVEIKIGDSGRVALRREQLRELAGAQERVEAAFLNVPELDGLEARDALAELTAALRQATAAADALWWLAPDPDTTTEED